MEIEGRAHFHGDRAVAELKLRLASHSAPRRARVLHGECCGRIGANPAAKTGTGPLTPPHVSGPFSFPLTHPLPRLRNTPAHTRAPMVQLLRNARPPVARSHTSVSPSGYG